jgi:hypothetical protein
MVFIYFIDLDPLPVMSPSTSLRTGLSKDLKMQKGEGDRVFNSELCESRCGFFTPSQLALSYPIMSEFTTSNCHAINARNSSGDGK